MNRTSPPSALSNWPASRLIAGALAIIIFAIDTFTPLDIAIAVLYVIVVLMAANFLRRRGVILVSLACAGLTVLSFILQHGYSDGSDSIGRTLVSLTAIGVTTILALNRQRAEDAWRRSETYLTEAQRLSRTGSFSWKIATEEQVWSEEIFRIYEYDFATKPTLDLVRRRSHPDDASMLEQAFEQASSGAQNIDITHRLLMPDGSVKHVKVLAHPAQDMEDNVEYVGVLMDITAAKRAEEALQELQASLAHVTRVTALGELTASIAHEVNQPLAAIVTYGDAGLRWLNREVPQLDEVRSAVERMIDCAKLAGEVIARLRALSRKTTTEMVRLDINEVVNEVLFLIRREISMHQVLVRLDLALSIAFRIRRSGPATTGDLEPARQQHSSHGPRRRSTSRTSDTFSGRQLRTGSGRGQGFRYRHRPGARRSAVQRLLHNEGRWHGHGPIDMPLDHRGPWRPNMGIAQ